MSRVRSTACAAVFVLGTSAAQAQAPGPATADPASLAPFFVAICLQSQSTAAARAALRGQGMVDNPQTGTFFHPQLNLSLNPTGGTCSMVFGLSGDGNAGLTTFRSALNAQPGVEAVTTDTFSPTDQTYGRAAVEVNW